MTATHAEDLTLLIEAVEAAGELALSFVGRAPRMWTKAHDSPVTEVDIAVEALLEGRLRKARPDYGFLSEEREDDGSRLRSERTFVVDPIDGTRSFITGGTDWTIPIAVVEGGRPVAAALFAPRRGELYTAMAGGGAFRSGDPISVSARDSLDGATLAVSRRLLKWSEDYERIRARNRFYASLAYRLARMADGRLDAVAIRANARDWDLAAADLLVHEAGGLLCDLNGHPPRYDRTVTDHSPLVATPPGLLKAMLRLTRNAVEAGAA